jgi:hypothetical protein
MAKKTGRFFALLLATLCVLASLTACGKKEVVVVQSGLTLDYATTGVSVVSDEDDFQKAYDEAVKNAQEGMISLDFRNEAHSTDGTHFDCYLANSVNNLYDMCVIISAEDNLDDHLFVSQLIPPGYAFNEVDLSRPLESGVHQLTVAFTQIAVENDEQVIKGQTLVSVNFYVD